MMFLQFKRECARKESKRRGEKVVRTETEEGARQKRDRREKMSRKGKRKDENNRLMQ